MLRTAIQDASLLPWGSSPVCIAIDTSDRTNGHHPRIEKTASTSRLEVIERRDLAKLPHWQVAFANERKDHRYYELLEDTIHPEFDYRYFVVRDGNGEVRAVQPFFL